MLKQTIFILAWILAWVSGAGADGLPVQSIKPAGSTVTFAQSLDWFDSNQFVVGRWDGSITLFRTPRAGEFGPVITQAMVSPSGKGLELVAAVNENMIVTSNDKASLAIWFRDTPNGRTDFNLNSLAKYDSAIGTANSAVASTINGKTHLVTGHENGHVLFWEMKDGTSFKLVRTVEVKSPNAPSNPWGLRNVRGLAIWKNHTLVTGSEDGDLVGLKISDGSEQFRIRYNDKAQRGINNISILDDHLLVANCSVGIADKNIWLFTLASGMPVLSDSENLILDRTKAQVFNFDADLVMGSGGLTFYSSTEEGLLWHGKIDGSQLIATGVTKSAEKGGSIMDISDDGGLIAVATHAVRLFKTR